MVLLSHSKKTQQFLDENGSNLFRASFWISAKLIIILVIFSLTYPSYIWGFSNAPLKNYHNMKLSALMQTAHTVDYPFKGALPEHLKLYLVFTEGEWDGERWQTAS